MAQAQIEIRKVIKRENRRWVAMAELAGITSVTGSWKGDSLCLRAPGRLGLTSAPTWQSSSWDVALLCAFPCDMACAMV